MGSIHGSTSWWGDVSGALIATRDGDALLSWVTADGLRLARIDLDAGSGGEVTPPPSTPPPSSEPPPEPSAPPPPVILENDGGSGGGGSFAWLDLALLALASMMTSLLRRRGNTR